MNYIRYLFNFENWSLLWLLGLCIIFLLYLWKLKPMWGHIMLFAFALALCYLVFGSPLNAIKGVGLHSIGMVQQILVLMVIPVLIFQAVPDNGSSLTFRSLKLTPILKEIPIEKNRFFVHWIIGALAMWVGHYLSAAILSARTGRVICGVSIHDYGSWRTVPDNLVLIVLLAAGFLFAFPVFRPDRNKRINPLARIIYLFTSCVNCSVLGLYVVFSASAAPVYTTVQSLAYPAGTLPWSLHTDQELAGMIMWVPGCLLYVMASVGILITWYNEGEHEMITSPSAEYINN